MIMRGIQSGIRSGIDSGVNGHLGGAVPVVWTAIVNCIASGSTLKDPIAAGWACGAVSTQSIPGDGSVEWSVALTDTHKACGLSVGDTDQDISDIDFGVYLQATGHWQVYESGVQVHNEQILYYTPSDVFRVRRVGATITYERDSGSGFVVFYTSLTSSSGGLLVDTSLYGTGSPATQLKDVTIEGAA